MSENTTTPITDNAPSPPAYFLSLTLTNFRCFGPKAQSLNLSINNGKPSQWTVILGENGTGKTSILQCLAGIKPSGKSSQTPSFLRFFIDSLASEDSSHSNSNKRITKLKYIIGYGWGIDSKLIKNVIEFETGTIEHPQIQAKLGFNHLPIAILCVAYGASRRMSRKAVSESRSEDACITLFDHSSDLLNAEEWLVLADYATKTGTDTQKRRAEDRYQHIRKCMVGDGLGTGLLPDVEDFRFTTTDDSAMTPRVEAKTPYGWVRVRDLSLGYQAALSWMIDFASRMFERYPNSENPLAEPAICLVDEIDLHLHPRWQRELVRVLTGTFPNTQFIVTAHSPLIVQAAPNANLALLRREGDHVVIENDVDYIRSWRVDQILASDLFGEVPVHAPEVEKLLEERTQLAGKTRLTTKDRVRLTELDKAIGRLPTAVHPEDQKAMDIIRRAAELLQQKNGGGA